MTAVEISERLNNIVDHFDLECLALGDLDVLQRLDEIIVELQSLREQIADQQDSAKDMGEV